MGWALATRPESQDLKPIQNYGMTNGYIALGRRSGITLRCSSGSLQTAFAYFALLGGTTSSAPHRNAVPHFERQLPVCPLESIITCSTLDRFVLWCLS